MAPGGGAYGRCDAPSRFARKLNSESCRNVVPAHCWWARAHCRVPSHWQPKGPQCVVFFVSWSCWPRPSRPPTTLVPDATSSPAPPRASALHSGRPIVPYAAPGERVERSVSARATRRRDSRRRRRSRRDAIRSVRARARLPPRESYGGRLRQVDLGPCSARTGRRCRRPVRRWPRRRSQTTRRSRRARSALELTRLSDTDALLAPDGDDVTLAGPVAIGVTAAGAPLPAASPPRRVADAGRSHGVHRRALRQRRRVRHGRYRTRASRRLPRSRRRTTSRPTASRKVRPAPRRRPRPRMAVDAAGNLLMPTRLGRHPRCATPACRCRASSGRASSRRSRSRCRRRRSSHSFTPEGGLLAADPRAADRPDGGVAERRDALRLDRRALHHPHRRTAIMAPASAASEVGARCAADLDCKGGTCSDLLRRQRRRRSARCDGDCTTGVCGRLFDFGPAVTGGGPVVIQRATPHFCQLPPHAACTGPGDCAGIGDACVGYAVRGHMRRCRSKASPRATTARTFSIRESIDGVDRNGDGDTDDMVMTFRDRASGKTEVLGATAGCGGLSAPRTGAPWSASTSVPLQLPGGLGRGRRARVPRSGVRPVVRRDRRHR